uniref:YSIRK-type signal peptide-containing protein n=1 Tax=Streptococcus sp. 1969 TaxID=2582688 RepID=UPI0015626A55
MFYKGNEDREKRLRFSIRKVSFGAASVAVAALFMFPGNGTVSATEQGVTPTNEGRQGSPLKEPDVQNGTYGATPVVSQLDGNSGSSETTAPKDQEETTTPTSTDASAPSVESPTVSKEKEETSTTASATEEKSAEKNTEVPSTEANSVENKEQTRVKTEEKAATPVTESHKPKLRKKRAVDASPTVATDADSDANQVYTAPRANAGLDELKEKLQELPNAIQNNTKVNNMDGLGAATGVEAGKVKEITEFGGWKAVNQADGSAGKFVVARATDKGVFPIETINTVGSDRKAWIGEQSVDRNSKYMLFLSEVRTQATRNKESYESLPYQDRQRDKRGAVVAIGVKGYKGVEKTFKVYDTKTPGKVTVDFKTGFSGIIESGSDVTVANYKVEVFSISNSGETKVYTTEFDPKKPSDDDKKTVVAAKVSTRAQSTNVAGITEANKAAALEELAKDRYKPYATGGRFTSKEIELPEGTTEYKVRISAANDRYLGMDYHSRFEQYALPLTGVGFNISQNTNVIAKDLLTKIYAKLKETVVEDEKGMTTDSIAAYDAELVKVQTLVEATNLTTTDAYKVALTTALQKKDELKVDKSTLISSKASLDDLVNDDPTPGKTPETVEAYNLAKTAAEQEAEKAKAVIDSDTATVDEVAQAVANVTAKRAELTAARALLVVAATDAQKTKLQNDSEALKEANKTGKTPKSIKEYEDKYKTLEAALTAAKEQAKTVLDKTVNAGKVEATYAQIEVDKIKAELDKAATLLKDKGNTTELEQAKNDLNDFINQQTTARVTEGQTKDSQDAYTTAKAAADKAVTDAQAVIDSENSTVEDVANALAEIKVKRAALEAAKKNLVPAATEAQKAKLEKTVAKLEKASLEGKTPDSVNEYNAKYDQLATDLEAAKQAAQEVAKKGTNASEVEALKAQEQVNAIKAKLAEAAGVLKD